MLFVPTVPQKIDKDVVVGADGVNRKAEKSRQYRSLSALLIDLGVLDTALTGCQRAVGVGTGATASVKRLRHFQQGIEPRVHAKGLLVVAGHDHYL